MKAAPDQAPLNILVVDDDEDIRVLLDKALKRLGHHISLAKSGEQALEMLQRSHFHAVITDVRLQEMSGIELMREIKEINATTQIYVITAHSDLEKVIQCMKGGAQDFFEKPLVMEDVVRTVNETSRRAHRWSALYKKHSFHVAS